MALGSKTGGRQKGTPNKATTLVRDAIASFAEGNVQNLEKWVDEVAKDNPGKAAEIFLRVLEYHVPKLRATEHFGEIEHKFPDQVNVNVVKPEDS